MTTDLLEDIKPTLKSLDYLYWIKDNDVLKISQGYVGQIFGNKHSITIYPSISYLNTSDYLRLIMHESNLFQDGNNFDYIEDDKITDYIIDNFFILLHKLIKEGIPRKYINNTKNTDYFVGNVNIEQTYFRYTMQIQPYISSVLQILSINYFSIAVLWQAYDKIIKKYPTYKNPFIDKVFINVNKIKHTKLEINNHRMFFHKNEKTLSNAYNFAKLIVNDMNILSGHNTFTSSILINSNDIFEKFIFKLLNSFLPDEPFIYHEGKKTIAHDENTEKVSIEPDILYKGLDTVVIDVKNKNFNKNFSNNDFFQIYSYCKAYNTKKGILVYPSNQESNSIKVLTTFDEDITLFALSINITDSNLNDRTKSYQDFVEKLKEIIHFS